MSNRLDPDQARYFVGPDVGAHCLQGLSAGNSTDTMGEKTLVTLSIFLLEKAKDYLNLHWLPRPLDKSVYLKHMLWNTQEPSQ